MTKTSERLSYLTLQQQGSLCKVITHLRNLSIYHTRNETCLTQAY